MGLDVIVGGLLEDDPELLDDLRADFGAVNGALREAGLPAHDEPEAADWTPVDYDMIGYSGLHYLRRFAVHLDNGGPVPRPGTEGSVDADPVVERYYDRAGGGSTVRGVLHATFGRNKRGPFDHLMLSSK